MPFLAGGHALPLPQKIAITNAAFLVMAYELTDQEEGWRDNVEDTMAILTFAGTAYILWMPAGVQAAVAVRIGAILAPAAIPAAIITSVIIAGGIVAYFIDPKEGVQNYRKFLTSSPKEMWKMTKTTTYPVLIEPPITRVRAFINFLGYIADRQLRRTGFHPDYPFII